MTLQRTALVLGANRGIGREAIRALLRCAWSVWAMVRPLNAMELPRHWGPDGETFARAIAHQGAEKNSRVKPLP